MSELLVKATGETNELCPKLTYKQRLIGFVTCSVFGWILSVLSTILFLTNAKKNPAVFAVVFTIGNLVSIAGTCFLSGPTSQFKKMMHKSRIFVTLLFIASMICTLVFALAVKIKVLVVIFIILQFLSYFWYSLTFIPFGEKIVKKICCQCCEEQK